MASAPAIRTERSFCRICTSQCGVVLEIAGERIVKVKGDRDHPVTRGYTCPKGRALGQMHHHPDRIERPLIRTAGALAPTDWDALLDDLSTKLHDIIDTHGPASVGIFFGSGLGMDAAGYRMAELLQKTIGTPAKFSPLTIDGTAKTLVSTLVGGFPGFSPRPDYDAVELVIFIGINPMISHGHTVAMPNPAPTIKAVAERGEVWVIDPRRSDTAGLATHHMAPRPGTDYAVLAYLIRTLLRGGASLLPPIVQLDALRDAVEPFDRDHAAAAAGVSGEQLDALLASVRNAGRLAVETGTGVTMSAGANVTVWLSWVLMILTDSMNRTAGVWFHPGFTAPMDGFPLPIIDHPFGPGPTSRPELQSFIGDWPCAAVPDEIEGGNMKALINLGGSLLRSFPDANALEPALRKLDLFVCMDIAHNETVALATHVLATKDQLERPDISLWDFLSPRVNAQYTPAIVDAIGDRRSTWWALAEIVRRLGGELPENLPASDSQPGADDAMLVQFLARARCSFDELSAARHVETDYQVQAAWVDAHVERLGGWRLAPTILVEQLRDVSAFHMSPACGQRTLSLIPRRQRRHVNANLLFLGDVPDTLVHPLDAADAGIANGDQVIVRSVRGEIVSTARLDEGIRPGCVSVPHGHADANVNLLTDRGVVDRITGMVRYSGIPVTLHPVPTEAVAAA